jgi:hypothetical protein
MPNTSLRLLLIAALIAGIYGGAEVLRHGSRRGSDLPVRSVDLGAVPRQLGVWTAAEKPSTAPIVEPPYDAIQSMNRVYRNGQGNTVSVEIDAFAFSQAESKLPHPPETCYINTGCALLDAKDFPLQRGAASPEAACLLVLQHDTHRFCVLYWYQLGKNVISSRYGLTQTDRKTWDQAVRPPVVRIEMLTTCSDVETAAERLRSAAEPLRAWTQRGL